MVRRLSIALSALGLAIMASAAKPAPVEAQQYITCQSYRDRTTHCSVNTRNGVRLVRRLSDAACTRGRSWGYDRNGIWVSRGCRAQFEVGRNSGRGRNDDWNRNDRGNRGRDDRWERNSRVSRGDAERVCRNAVRSRIRGSSVNVDWAGSDRRGNSVVRWRSGRNAGSCSIDARGRLVDFNRSR